MSKTLPKGSAEHINRLNKIKVLNLIRQHQEISRADIVKMTNISAPTVTRIVESLLNKEGLVKNVGIRESNGGRPPMVLRFQGEENYVVGIDWGRTHIHGILSDLNANPLMELDIPSQEDNDFKTDLKKVINLIEYLITKSNIDPGKLMGIGVAVAGYVNRNSGIVEYSPNFKWFRVDVKKPLKERFNVPIKVNNVSHVMAMCELLYGENTEFNDFIFVNLGYGIGAGIISEGNLFSGYDGYSGEFGHNRVFMREGRTCACGKIDCLECYASGRGIAETVRMRMDQHRDSVIHVLCNHQKEHIDTAMVAKAANSGDSFCKQTLLEAAEILGYSLASFANLFNPRGIILGGKVVLSGDFFLTKIKEAFYKDYIPNTGRNVNIIRSSWSDKAAVKGAVSLILNEILNFNLNKS